jgi:uncharacterized protein YyaL (SSP411 family)
MQILAKVKTAIKTTSGRLVDRWERLWNTKLYTSLHQNLDPAKHLREAADWMCRAQDHGSDRGVSWGAVFGQSFLTSYPETTGYIINTFLELARHYGDETYFRRAVDMGDWETEIQMDCGAVMAGRYNTNPTPAIFNTGMVLLGWAGLYRATGDGRYRTAGYRAGRWLLEMQEPNGQWIRGNSHFVNPTTTVYDVKAAWGLAEMGATLGEPMFLDAAVRNAEFALTKQNGNGWFEDCAFQDTSRPLLHTIAYTMQGLVGVGEITGRREFIDGAARTAHALVHLMDDDGYIPGKIDRDFRPAADWCCLTGSAQTSVVWSQLAALKGDARFAQAADLANRYLMARHDISSPSPYIRGGLAGSWPLWGGYERFRVLNWATKFFADALLARAGHHGSR